MAGNNEVKTGASNEVSYYDNFWSIWWNLTAWSVLYVLCLFIAAVVHRSSEPFVQVFETFTDILPALTLLCIIILLIFIDRVVLGNRSAKWSVVRTQIRKRKMEVSGAVMSMGSLILIVSDLHFHKVMPIVVSMPLWAFALWLEKSSEDGSAKVDHGDKNSSQNDV